MPLYLLCYISFDSYINHTRFFINVFFFFYKSQILYSSVHDSFRDWIKRRRNDKNIKIMEFIPPRLDPTNSPDQ